MKSPLSYLFVSIILLIVFSSCSSKYIWTDVNRTAPAIQRNTVEGEMISFPDEGRITVIHFFTITEPVSRASLKPFQEVYDRLDKKNGVQVLSVNVGWGVSESQLKTALSKENVTYPVVFDGQRMVQNKFQVSSVPQTAIVNKNGIVDWVMHGYRDDIDFAQKIINKVNQL